jgi:hypothetical protein
MDTNYEGGAMKEIKITKKVREIFCINTFNLCVLRDFAVNPSRFLGLV